MSWIRSLVIGLLCVAPLGAGAGASASAGANPSASLVGDDVVRVSMLGPGDGLNCREALQSVRVVFEALEPPFAVTRISLLVDGEGVPEDAVDQKWPTITLHGGLHEGTNRVDLVASDDGGHSLTRQVEVIAGPESSANQPDVLPIQCVPAVTAAAPEAPADPPRDDLAYAEQTVTSVYDRPRFVYVAVPVWYPAPVPGITVHRSPSPGADSTGPDARKPPRAPPEKQPLHPPTSPVIHPIQPPLPKPKPQRPAPRKPEPVAADGPQPGSSPPSADTWVRRAGPATIPSAQPASIPSAQPANIPSAQPAGPARSAAASGVTRTAPAAGPPATEAPRQPSGNNRDDKDKRK